jgi:hypothetical protein
LSAARFSETAPGFSSTLRIVAFLEHFSQQDSGLESLRNSPGITSGCFHVLKSQPETSVRDFAQHLDPSLTLRVGIDGTYFGTVPKC